MLIQLKVTPTNSPQTCGNGSKCDTCRIGPNGGGWCGGCKDHCHPKKGYSKMDNCFRECATCGGGPAAPNTVPAICCKSPLSDLFLNKVERESYAYKRRPQIDIDQTGIVVTQGSVGNIKDPFPAETEAVAVNLRHVWSTKGWFSRDMKDYLKVPRKAKLILLTMTKDDVLERAWDKNLHEEDWGSVGFDYWQPLTFSYYVEDSRMNQYFQFRRTLLATETSKAWFAPPPPFLLSKKTDGLLRDCAERIPQLMINIQFITSDAAFTSFANEIIIRADKAVPPDTSFWFVGLANPRYIGAVKKLLPGRKCYFLSTGPWLAGHKGRRYTIRGKMAEAPSVSKQELVIENQRTYRKMVQEA